MKTKLSLGQQARRQRSCIYYFCWTIFFCCCCCCMYCKDQTCTSLTQQSVFLLLSCATHKGGIYKEVRKKWDPHLFHLVRWCSRENASGEGKAALMSLSSQQGIWCVLVTWKGTAAVIDIKTPPFCPGPPAIHYREAVAQGCSALCTLTVPSLQPIILDKSGAW